MTNSSVQWKIDWGLVIGLSAFGVAMGHVEAVVDVYIRKMLHILPTPEQFDAQALAEGPGWFIATEQTREAATIVMLAALALMVGRTGRQRLGILLYSFGIWDIVYYISLKLMIDWPVSLATIDCLFLIPVLWYFPVWMPVTVSTFMIIIGARLMQVPHKVG